MTRRRCPRRSPSRARDTECEEPRATSIGPLELGERALAEWVPGTREFDYAEHLHLHADATYWTGRYERCAELSRQARALGADVHVAEALLRGGGTEALALAGLGRHEEAIQIWDELFVIARELGRSVARRGGEEAACERPASSPLS